MEELRTKYLTFSKDKLDVIIKDMSTIRLITGQMMAFPGHEVKLCTMPMQYFMLKIHKFFRFWFVTTYYYIFPFLILVFQTMLLYAGEIYTNYKLKSVDDADVGTTTQTQFVLVDPSSTTT